MILMYSVYMLRDNNKEQIGVNTMNTQPKLTAELKTKIETLAKFLQTDFADAECRIDDYLVLTDEEADEKVKEYILDSLWAFNADFIESHSDSGLNADDIRTIQQKKCEDANDFVKRIIKDIDHFISDAVMSDGRGHFISQYDGKENEQGNYFIYRIN